jgi:acyl-CoA synthetase (AMP-forming)/AMP-acid ligase II
MLELIEAERVTFLPGVPTMLLRIIEHPDFGRRDLSSLRAVCSGGTTVPAELVRRIEDSPGVDFSISYGQTEASPGVTQTFPDDAIEDKAATAGPPLPQTEVKIVDTENGETLPLGTIGELCTRGYLVMHGYFEMPEETAKAIDGEGWLHSGDLCSMDERGGGAAGPLKTTGAPIRTLDNRQGRAYPVTQCHILRHSVTGRGGATLGRGSWECIAACRGKSASRGRRRVGGPRS